MRDAGVSTAPVASPRRVALVHDFLLDLRGAERVFLTLCDLFPDADVFTAVHDPKGTRGRFDDRHVVTTPLQRLRPDTRWFRALMPLYPAAIEQLDLRGYDLVISSSSAWAHGVLAPPEAVHLCYCHNPFRYAWDQRHEALRPLPAPARAAAEVLLGRWRTWDQAVARRVDRYVANSETTRERIRRCYGRDSDVLYPPVETGRFAPRAGGPDPDGDYVVLSALMPHKRIDLAVRACTVLGLPLTVIGDGPDLARLQRLAGPSVTFAGRLEDTEVASALASARAMIVTAAEEFGIAAVEVQAAGRPVVAPHEGGLRATVVEGVTGTFFHEPTLPALVEALRRFDPLDVDPDACVANARRFDVATFQGGVLRLVDEAVRARAAQPVDRDPEQDRRLRRRRGLAGAR